MIFNYRSPVDVHFDDGVTDDERAEVDTWVQMHDLGDIDTVVVGARAVAVHGLASHSAVAGTARRQGNVIAELNEALAMMRTMGNT